MALLSKDFFSYQQSIAANTCQQLIAEPPKAAAVVLPYIPSMNTEHTNLSNERTFILAADIGLSPSWSKVVSKLQAMSRPAIITEAAWRDIHTAFGQLTIDKFGLLKLIINHEWTIADIFGCNLTAPMSKFEEMGLLLLLSQGYVVVGVNKERIKIMKYNNSMIKKRQSRLAKEDLLTHLI